MAAFFSFRQTDMTDNRKNVQILVVDDERLIRLTLAAKLRLYDYQAVCVASTQEAAALLENGGWKRFSAVITDIVMEGMDGFVFRDILRGLAPDMPVFFLTAMDPEEGGGFLKRILEDASSFYLPKAVKADVLVRRVQGIVASRHIAEVISQQNEETEEAMRLAAHVQRSLLPPSAEIDSRSLYTTWWHPKDIVSGDLYETRVLDDGTRLFLLGDVQGHGTGAALSMMAVQSFIKQLSARRGLSNGGPAAIANELQQFVSANFGGVSYMTALICLYNPETLSVDWISCGAPDLEIIDPMADGPIDINPERRGGLPVGLMADTVYSEGDVVHTVLSKSAMCVACTDGIHDISRDAEGYEQMPDSLRRRMRDELLCDARLNGSSVAAPYKFVAACEAYGYYNFADDVTMLIFGPKYLKSGVMTASVAIRPEAIDAAAESIGVWCELQGWGVAAATKLQLVFEEKMMNLHDHGIDARDRLREVACIRLRRRGANAELTVWDSGTQEPSIEVAAGSADTAFELKNREFSGRGRGRLMVREICDGIMRNKFGDLNETTYFVPLGEDGNEPSGAAAEEASAK